MDSSADGKSSIKKLSLIEDRPLEVSLAVDLLAFEISPFRKFESGALERLEEEIEPFLDSPFHGDLSGGIASDISDQAAFNQADEMGIMNAEPDEVQAALDAIQLMRRAQHAIMGRRRMRRSAEDKIREFHVFAGE